jgi:hypothetical protein
MDCKTHDDVWHPSENRCEGSFAGQPGECEPDITFASLAAERSAPYWVRDLARLFPTKDPVDVLNGLDALLVAAQAHSDAILGASRPSVGGMGERVESCGCQTYPWCDHTLGTIQ